MTNSDQQEVIPLGAHLAFHSDSEGKVSEVPLAVGLRVQGKKFVADLPEYIGESVEADTFQGVIHAYEGACELYSAKRLAQTCELMYGIVVRGEPSTTATNFGLDAMAAMGIAKVFVAKSRGIVVGVYHVAADDTAGRAVSVPLILVPINDAVKAKADILIASIRAAGSILNDLQATSNPEQFLLNISSDWQAPADPVAAQAVLPFDDDSL